MRTTFSSVAILASSLLATEVFAAPHLHLHKRAVVTDLIIVTQQITVTDDHGTFETGAPVAVGTTTLYGTPVAVSTPPTATLSSYDVPVSPSSEAPISTPPASYTDKPKPITPMTTAEPKGTTAPPSLPEPVTSPLVVPTSTAAAAPAAGLKSDVAAGSSGKRGLAYNDASLLSGFLSSGSHVSWGYNWASDTKGFPSSIEYVPILLRAGSAYTSVWNSHADAALKSGSTHLLGFNEPDNPGEANLSVNDAVSGHMTYMEPYASKAHIGTVAVTNGGGQTGLTYLQNFINGLNGRGGHYDFCAVHWYDTATNIDYFKSFVQQAGSTCGKKIWITEFAGSGSADQQNTFLKTVLPWLDQQDYVERYAYFMVTPGYLISSGTSLSTLGQTYAYS